MVVGDGVGNDVGDEGDRWRLLMGVGGGCWWGWVCSACVCVYVSCVSVYVSCVSV